MRLSNGPIVLHLKSSTARRFEHHDIVWAVVAGWRFVIALCVVLVVLWLCDELDERRHGPSVHKATVPGAAANQEEATDGPEPEEG